MKALWIAIILISFSGCSSSLAVQWIGPGHGGEDIIEPLVQELVVSDDFEIRLVLAEQILDTLDQEASAEATAQFVQTYEQNFPNDPYLQYYWLRLGQGYKREGQHQLSRLYLERILGSDSSIQIQSNSMERIALEELIELDGSEEIKIRYLKRLLDHYPNHPNRAIYLYQSGRLYENLGFWDHAHRNYRALLDSPRDFEQLSTGEQNYIQRYDQLAQVNGGVWSYAELDRLVAALSSAIYRRSIPALTSLSSPLGFFTRSSIQDEQDYNSLIPFQIVTNYFSSGRNIRVAERPVERVRGEEYTLLVTGLSPRIDEWYMVLRRIDFPANPLLHNSWEWSGIILGGTF